MREIKFRIWDKEKQKMREVSDICFIDGKPEIIGYNVFSGEKRHQKFPSLMQFTGLKDKNGKEIYESDIVSLGGLQGWIIEYSGRGFEARPLESNNILNQYTIKNNNYLQFEIIGNIHDSKEQKHS